MSDPQKMTAEEFEAAYAKRSGMTVEQLRKLGRQVRPCTDCDYEHCEGWQSLSGDALREYDDPEGFAAYLRDRYSSQRAVPQTLTPLPIRPDD